MKRRSFFKSFMGLVATVALAPEIAFGRKLEFTSPQFYFPEPSEFFLVRWTVEDGVETRTVIEPEEWEKALAGTKCKVIEARPYSEFQELRRKAGLTVE